MIVLRYLGASAIAVQGPATGRRYAFSQTLAIQAVDPLDAPALLRSSLFRRA
jgi:hypothetical protein